MKCPKCGDRVNQWEGWLNGKKISYGWDCLNIQCGSSEGTLIL